jgi:hypothetical protein
MDVDATEKQAEEYVHFLSAHAVPKAIIIAGNIAINKS